MYATNHLRLNQAVGQSSFGRDFRNVSLGTGSHCAVVVIASYIADCQLFKIHIYRCSSGIDTLVGQFVHHKRILHAAHQEIEAGGAGAVNQIFKRRALELNLGNLDDAVFQRLAFERNVDFIDLHQRVVAGGVAQR